MFSFMLGLFKGCGDNLQGLEITMYDIGKADCFLLQIDDKNVMIDAGLSKNKDEILKSLKDKEIKKIDYLILTHMDKDHIGSADNIIEEIEVDNLIMPEQTRDSKQFRKLQEAIEAKDIEPILLHEEMRFEIEKGKFIIYPPMKDSYEKSNDYSLITSLKYGEKSFLFAGDAEAIRLEEFMENDEDNYDFLKVPHHGNFNKNSEAFINYVKPDYAVITSDRENEPSKELLSILDSEDIKTYLTIDGEIIVRSDGNQIEVEQK